MRKKLAGIVLAATLSLGAVGPFAATAHANGDSDTDPVLCFVASLAIITDALEQYQGGHLTGAELRSILVGTSTFLGDCLTPSVAPPPPPDIPVFPPIVIPPIHIPPFIPPFP